MKERLKDEDKKFGYSMVRIRPLFEYAKSAFIIMPNLLPFIKAASPDLIISHDLLSPSTFWSCFYKRSHPKTQLILDTHAAEYNTNFNTLVKKTYLVLWKIFIRRLVLKYADRIVAIGENEQSFARQYLFAKVKVSIEIIPLGADTERFKPDPENRKLIRKELGYADDDIVIVNAGKLNQSKKNMELLAVFNELQKSFSRARLLFIGGGDPEYLDKMTEYIKKHHLNKKITLKGMVDNNSLGKYLSACNIGAWPGSKSNVFLEAMATGLPLIIENKAYAKPFTSHNNGFNITPGSKQELNNALARLLENDVLRTEMSQNSYQLAHEKYSWKVISKEFLKSTFI